MEEKRSTAVHHNGKIAYYLSERLAKQQHVSDQEMDTLIQLHQEKLAVYDQMKNTTNRLELRRLAGLVETIEFEMQKNWHFDLNKDFHEWYLVPNCTCPRMDNEDRRGTPYRVVDAKCPVHGEPR